MANRQYVDMDESRAEAANTAPQGWCVCGEKVPIAEAREVTLPNGRDGWQGHCPSCGAPLFAIKRKKKAD